VTEPARPVGRRRPRRAAGPVAASILTLAAWEAVAHNSGSGWVQSLGALLAAFLLIGLVAPAVAVGRIEVAVVANPADGAAGSPSTLTVSVSKPCRLIPRSPGGETVLTGAQREVELVVVPEHRGEITSCRVLVGSAAPFGLLWWERRFELFLPRPLVVSPRVGAPDPVAAAHTPAPGEEARRVPTRVGEPRGVRPYQPGDLRHWVHWPATAHTGSLMVREMEGPMSSPVVVDVVLPADPEAAERHAERAMGTVQQFLASGRVVELRTVEAGGPVVSTVHDLGSAGRRLARAVASPQARLS
jgi:uncharacterized protein (DUF58 family)